MAFGISNDFKGSVATPPGSHLAGPGPYRDQIAALTAKYPGLRYRRGLQADHSKYHKTGRAAVYHFGANDEHKFLDESAIITDTARLRRVLAQNCQSNRSSAARELIILEGLQPDFVATIGELWQIDPQLFERHQFTGFWSLDHQMGSYHAIPSWVDPSRTFSFNYWEMLFFDQPLSSGSLRCAENHRNIMTTSIGSKRDRTGTISRKISYWSRKHLDGGWQALVIVDQALDHVIVGKGKEATTERLGYSLFQGGYHDPVSYDSLEHAASTPGPPRTSTLDDLAHYIKYHGKDLDYSEPVCTTRFLKLIVYSNMTKVFYYTRGLFDQLEYKLDRQQNFAVQNPEATLLSFWSDLHHFRWRLEYFVRNLTHTTLQLGIDEYQISPLDIKDPVDKNFLFLQRQLRELERRSSGIFESYGVLSQIASSRQGLLETKAAQNLQYLAVIFLPLSFAASLFSMERRYNLGQEKFWAYVVTAAILLYLALLGAWLLRGETQEWLRSCWQKIKRQATLGSGRQQRKYGDTELQEK